MLVDGSASRSHGANSLATLPTTRRGTIFLMELGQRTWRYRGPLTEAARQIQRLKFASTCSSTTTATSQRRAASKLVEAGASKELDCSSKWLKSVWSFWCWSRQRQRRLPSSPLPRLRLKGFKCVFHSGPECATAPICLKNELPGVFVDAWLSAMSPTLPLDGESDGGPELASAPIPTSPS